MWTMRMSLRVVSCPTLPGESTRISSALALFGASRILNETLEEFYTQKTDYNVCVSKICLVDGHLDDWQQALPAHLRLEFSQDKPNANATGSRSLLLSLVYYFIRSLIHRPAVCFAEEHVRSPSVLALSDSSKHIIQIFQLLDERRLCLSVSINRKELLFFSGLGLLWQTMGLKRDSKLVRESRKLLYIVLKQLEPESFAAATEFGILANILVPLDICRREAAPTGRNSQETMKPAHQPSRSSKKPLQSLKSPLMASFNRDQSSNQGSPSRRTTIPCATCPPARQSLRPPSWTSLSPCQPDQPSAASYPADKEHYLDIGSDLRLGSSTIGYDYPRALSCSTSDTPSGAITMADLEYVPGDMGRGCSNIFTGKCGEKGCCEDSSPFASIAAEHGREPNDSILAIPQPPASYLHNFPPKRG
jgi:hypothetical protein